MDPTVSPALIPSCKAPDAVLTQVSRFRVRPELEAHKRPPMHDTRTRVAIDNRNKIKDFILRHKYIVQGIQRHWYLLHHLMIHGLNSTTVNMRKTNTTEYGQDPNFPREGYT